MLIECTSFQILDLYGKILPVLFLALRPIFVFLDSDKEPESNENGLGIISKLKDGSLDASTLIQVNATIMIGVVFFVSISSALSLETVEGGSFVTCSGICDYHSSVCCIGNPNYNSKESITYRLGIYRIRLCAPLLGPLIHFPYRI